MSSILPSSVDEPTAHLIVGFISDCHTHGPLFDNQLDVFLLQSLAVSFLLTTVTVLDTTTSVEVRGMRVITDL